MANPTTRQEFKDHCLRRLGHPVINIEVTEEQIDDRVDEALAYYWDYHFSGTDRTYYKHLVTSNNQPDRIYSCNVVSGGTGYANSDNVVFTSVDNRGANAAATINTYSNGTIESCILSNSGVSYAQAPTVTVESGTGSGASITAELGGWIPVPDNIIGAIRVFPVGQSLSSNDIFNIRYQIALNDLYTLTHTSILPYFSAFQHVELLEQMLVGNQPIRYSRHKNRVYIDMDWGVVSSNTFLVIEAHEIVDPTVYADVWKDRWLQRYTTQLIKRQWGEHLSKYGGMMMPGGIQFDGVRILTDAQNEIAQLEADMLTAYSVPPLDMIGAWGPLLINSTIGLSSIGLLYNVWNSLPMA